MNSESLLHSRRFPRGRYRYRHVTLLRFRRLLPTPPLPSPATTVRHGKIIQVIDVPVPMRVRSIPYHELVRRPSGSSNGLERYDRLPRAEIFVSIRLFSPSSLRLAILTTSPCRQCKHGVRLQHVGSDRLGAFETTLGHREWNRSNARFAHAGDRSYFRIELLCSLSFASFGRRVTRLLFHDRGYSSWGCECEQAPRRW